MQIAARFYEKHGLRNCVGIVDGTTVIFIQKPAVDGRLFSIGTLLLACCMLCVNVFYVALFMYLSIFIGKLYINGVDPRIT